MHVNAFHYLQTIQEGLFCCKPIGPILEKAGHTDSRHAWARNRAGLPEAAGRLRRIYFEPGGMDARNNCVFEAPGGWATEIIVFWGADEARPVPAQ